jgi:glucosamine--fructose-6-phosphate aminotransferase (isomerizing)
VGHQEAWPIIFAGLKRLEYRGYDSAGIVITDATELQQFRWTSGRVDGLNSDIENKGNNPKGSIGLGHTRWATHGKPSRSNAHPQTDCHQKVAVVHNGIVENFLELKRILQNRGHRFTSETDTEIIAHSIEEGLSEGLTFENAFLKSGRSLKGSNVVAATLQGEAGKICTLRTGQAGGIVVVYRDGQSIVCSDLSAMFSLLRPYAKVNQVNFLEDGQMAILTREGIEYLDMEGNPVQAHLQTVSPDEYLISKSGYRHFMLKEIMEQPQTVASALRQRVDFEGGRVDMPDFSISKEDVRDIHRVVLIGCGSSLYAAQVGSHLVERLSGLTAEADSASEFRYRDAPIDRHTLVVSISQSGETADTVAAMQEVRKRGGRLITICNVNGSQATQIAEVTLYMHSGIEIGVASTKTFIASITILNLLATYLGQTRGFLKPARTRQLVNDIGQCPKIIAEILSDTATYKRLARKYCNYNSFLYLGRGINSAIAREGALKLKELSYIHAEGYPAGEMKHGPIALIDQHIATLALAPRDKLYNKMISNIKEVKARDGVVIAVLTSGDKAPVSHVDDVIYIPEAPECLIPMLATIPLQLLAYHIAVSRGCNIDQPRNLAKSVTVE